MFLCMERLFLLTSPLPPRTEGSLWLFAGGRVGLTAESWPSDKASSLQALTGNGARADALGWLARPELGRARPGAGWRPHRAVNESLSRETLEGGGWFCQGFLLGLRPTFHSRSQKLQPGPVTLILSSESNDLTTLT